METSESQDESKQTNRRGKPVDSNGEHLRKRRRGREAHELAAFAQCSGYKARQAMEVGKYSPELAELVIRGEGSLKDAVNLVRTFRPIKRRKPELTFDEEVERSFKRWLAKWPKEEQKKVRAIVDLM